MGELCRGLRESPIVLLPVLCESVTELNQFAIYQKGFESFFFLQ